MLISSDRVPCRAVCIRVKDMSVCMMNDHTIYAQIESFCSNLFRWTSYRLTMGELTCHPYHNMPFTLSKLINIMDAKANPSTYQQYAL